MIIAVGSTTSSGNGTGTGSGGSSRFGSPVFEWSLTRMDRIPKVITFEATSDSTFPFTIDWGDGTEEEVTSARVVSKSYSGPFGTFEARFSIGARVAPQAINGFDEFFSLSNIVVGDSTFEFSTAGFSRVSDIPARILTTLNDTFRFGRIPLEGGIPSNIGSWDVSGVTEFRKTFFNNPFVDDSFGQWVFGDSARLGDDTFNLMSDDDVASCLVQWDSVGQGTGVQLVSTFSDSTGARAPRQLSESTYPAAKAAYDNLLSTYNWTDSDTISWVATYTPPLDTYTGATAAYSVRKLSSSYSGPCIEAYRVSDGATQDIGFDADGLIDTAAIVTFASGGEVRVRTWYDQSGNGLDAVQTTFANQPQIYDGTAVITENDAPAILWDGTRQTYLQTGLYDAWSDGSSFTTMVFNGRRGPAGSQTYWDIEVGVQRYSSGAGNIFALFYGSTQLNVSTNVAPTTQGLHTWYNVASETNAAVYIDGALKGTNTRTNPVGDTNVSAYIGSRVGGSQWNSSHYQEIIHYGSDVVSIRTGLESNINDYFQIANIPATTGFLADYPDAAAAYSVRSLSNNAIKCMRVRRNAAPFDEQDIGFTSGGDLDEAAIVAFGGSDVLTVAAWYDQSGQSRHATQTTSGLQPQIYDGTSVITENGKPALKCFNSEGLISTGAVVSFPITYFAAYTSNGVGGGYQNNLVGIDRPVSGAYTLVNTSGGTTIQTTHDGYKALSHSASLTQGDMGLYRVVINGTSSEAGVNGSSTSGTLAASGSTQNIGVNYVAAGGGAGNNADNHVSEVLLFDDAKNSTDITGIETNINDYFEIIVNDEAATSGFLFDYPNAAGAYSVRQLNNNAEFAMQVRRSDGRTKNIGFDGNGDLDTQAISTFGGSDELFISRWYDQTGGQNHSISSGASLLIYDGTSVLTKNGKPIGQVHATSGASSANIGMTNSTGLSFTHSLYSVMQRPNAPSSLNMFGTTNSSVTALYQERAGNLTYGPGWTSFGIYTYSTVSNQPRLYSYIRKNGTDGECFNDGVSQGTTTAMNSSIQVDIESVRCDRNSNAVQADCGGLQEFISYPDDRTAVGDNANILANIKAYFTGIP